MATSTTMTSRMRVAMSAPAAAPPRRQSNCSSSPPDVMTKGSLDPLTTRGKSAFPSDAASRAARRSKHSEYLLNLLAAVLGAQGATQEGHSGRRGGRPGEIHVEAFLEERLPHGGASLQV